MSDLIINEEAVEPKDYFKTLKLKSAEFDVDAVHNQLEQIAHHILKAKEIGQTSLIRKVAFLGDVLLKEQILYSAGLRYYVMMEDITHYIDKVKPSNSVKIIELERYPRTIPFHCMEAIAEAQKLGVFSDFCVVFTDFTNNKYQTPEETQMIARNRDPIVFGYFMDKQTGVKHERFYMITDWEDEYCHLNFAKMMDEIGKEPLKLGYDATYIQQLIGTTMVETTKKERSLVDTVVVQEKKLNFWERLLTRGR